MHLYWDRLLWTMQLKMTLNLWSSYIYLPSTGIPGLCQYSCLLQCWEWKSGPSYTDSHSTKWATSIALAQWFKRRHLWVAEAACRHSCIPVHVFMHTSNLSSISKSCIISLSGRYVPRNHYRAKNWSLLTDLLLSNVPMRTWFFPLMFSRTLKVETDSFHQHGRVTCCGHRMYTEALSSHAIDRKSLQGTLSNAVYEARRNEDSTLCQILSTVHQSCAFHTSGTI